MTNTVDSTYMRYLEQSDSQKWRVEWWLPGPGEKANRNYCLMCIEFEFGKMKVLEMDGSDGDGWRWMMMNGELPNVT